MFLTAAVGITAVPANGRRHCSEPGATRSTGTTPADPAEPKADDTPATTTPERAARTTTRGATGDRAGDPDRIPRDWRARSSRARRLRPDRPPTEDGAGDAHARGESPGEPDDDELDATRPATSGRFRRGRRRPIAFPVLGPVSYSNDWGACRDGCTRRHQGTDVLGVRLQPLLAAVDGTVTRIQHAQSASPGDIPVTGVDGWYYNYFHINDDTPGADDGLAARSGRSPPAEGRRPVRAGQVIGYMGDSGNAERRSPTSTSRSANPTAQRTRTAASSRRRSGRPAAAGRHGVQQTPRSSRWPSGPLR